MAAKVPTFEDHLTCPVCLELFSEPRRLPCGHVLCSPCLESICTGAEVVSCPECRMDVPLDGGIDSVEKDFRVAGLVETYRKECELENVKPGDAECMVHGGKAELFCESCENFVCVRCVTGQHKGHECADIGEVYRTYENRFIKEVMPKLQSKLDEVRHIKQRHVSHIQKIAEEEERAKQTIDVQFSEVFALLEEKKSHTLKEVETQARKRVFKSHRLISCCEEQETQFSDIETQINSVLELKEEPCKFLASVNGSSKTIMSAINGVDMDDLHSMALDLPKTFPPFQLNMQTLHHDIERVELDWDPRDAAASSLTLSADIPDDTPGFASEANSTENVLDDCSICLDTVTNPKTLHKCDHVFCQECIDQQFQYKPQCPQCGVVYGKIIGNQPEGYMSSVVKSKIQIPGYEEYGCIIVDYSFFDGVQGPEHPSPGKPYYGTTRSAFIPNSPEGQKIAKMLKLAFDQKLVFTVGTSRTTGQDNVVTWNDIHHKTRITGGPEEFGYPDPTYLDRVREELAAKGVTEGDIE